MNKYPCPSCGYMMFDELPGSQDICEICFWQDDLIDLEELYQAMGPNKVSLYEAQKIFQKFGAIEKRFINNVRKPGIDDKKDPNWRLLNQAIDKNATLKNSREVCSSRKEVEYERNRERPPLPCMRV